MWFGSSRLVSLIITWAVSLLLVRILSPQDFGLVAMGMSYVSIIEIFYDFNIGFAILQKADLTEEETHSCFWFMLGGITFWYAISWFLAKAVAAFYQSEQLTFLVRIMMLGLVFQGVSGVPFWLLTKKLDFSKRAKATMWAAIPSTIITLVLALKGLGVLALALRFVFFNFFFCVFLYGYFPWRPKLMFRLSALRSILTFSLSVTGFRFFRYAATKCDNIIIGKFLGAELLGYYRVALEFSRIPIDRGIVLLNQVSFPVYAELQNDLLRLKDYFLKISRYILFLALPIFLGAAVMAHEAFRMILGERWLAVVPIFQIMCFASIPEALVGNLVSLNNAVGKPNRNLAFSLVAAVALTGGFLVAVRFGLVGVAAVWVTIYPLVFVFFLRGSLNLIQSSLLEFFKTASISIVGSLGMALAVLTFQNVVPILRNSLSGSSFLVLFGGCVYVLFFLIFDREFMKDVQGIFRGFLWAKVLGRQNTRES